MHEEDFALLKKAQNGDNSAKEEILQKHLNLVRSVIRRFTNRGYEWDDLFQVGCIGLMKAVERFDVCYNVRFSTYAVPMIIGEIRRFLRDDNPVKVSRPIKELAYKIHKIQEQLQGTLGREPTISEVSTQLKISPQEVVAALDAVQPLVSIYDQAFFDDGTSMTRLEHIKASVEDDSGTIEKLALKEVLLRLPPREQLIIKLRFFEDKTQSEIAAIIGLSQVQVSRLEKQAIKFIREFLQTS